MILLRAGKETKHLSIRKATEIVLPLAPTGKCKGISALPCTPDLLRLGHSSNGQHPLCHWNLETCGSATIISATWARGHTPVSTWDPCMRSAHLLYTLCRNGARLTGTGLFVCIADSGVVVAPRDFVVYSQQDKISSGFMPSKEDGGAH